MMTLFTNVYFKFTLKYSRETNTVFQYHGCFFHGCPDCYTTERDAPYKQYPSLSEKYKNTIEISNGIINAGYVLEEMWDCEWRTVKKSLKLDNSYLYPTETIYKMTEVEILEHVKNGNIFGAVVVDIQVPQELKNYFSEMTPIFKNTMVKLNDIGEYMQRFLKDTGISFRDTRYLIGSMFGTEILLITPLLKWYLEHGLVVTKVYQVIQFKPIRCFKEFSDQVSRDRRSGEHVHCYYITNILNIYKSQNRDSIHFHCHQQDLILGDRDKSKAIIAETSKLIGNSVYGHSIMDRSKFTDTTFCNRDKASNLVNFPHFKSLDEYEDTFEVLLNRAS